MAVTPVAASHAWGTYHWARTSNPLVLQLGDNLNATWDPHLVISNVDWNPSTVIDTRIVAGGTSPKACRPTSGRVEVCNAAYGGTGWLGIAQVWTSGGHITQGVVKLNDTYFNTAKYNTPAWRNMVTCQEIGHTFGLGHQDEDFGNTNLGSCMDYTNDPTGIAGTNGIANNEHPNGHDMDQLVAIYGGHADTSNTASASIGQAGADGGLNPADWGRPVAFAAQGRGRVFQRDLPGGQRLTTFVYWTEEASGRRPHEH